jgi:hypothetical protein
MQIGKTVKQCRTATTSMIRAGGITGAVNHAIKQ